jgi:hypothetical protein
MCVGNYEDLVGKVETRRRNTWITVEMIGKMDNEGNGGI